MAASLCMVPIIVLLTIGMAIAQLCNGKYQLVNSSTYTISEFKLYNNDGFDVGRDMLEGIPLGSQNPSSRWLKLGTTGSVRFVIFLSGQKTLSGAINNLCANERSIVVSQDAVTHQLRWRLQ
jgi:hypothetical protein